MVLSGYQRYINTDFQGDCRPLLVIICNRMDIFCIFFNTYVDLIQESTGTAHCYKAQCQTRCTASLETLASASDRVLCCTSCNVSAPRCSTYLQTLACENQEQRAFMKYSIRDSFLCGETGASLATHLGLSHSRSADCTPVPHVLEQWDQVVHCPQPPFTVSGSLPTITHSPEIHH